MSSNQKFLNDLSSAVKDSEKKLETLRIEIDKAKRVGADVSDMQKEYEALLAQVNRFKKVYGV